MKRFISVTLAAALVFALFLSANPADAQPSISGKVVETMDSGGYSYVCLEKSGKKTWVAVPKTNVKKGQTMSFQPGAEMVNFESRTLKRKFDKIIFSAGPAVK